MDDVSAAKIIIKCLDLTSLNPDDTEDEIIDLCRRAQTPYGNAAAVCICPKFVPLAKNLLTDTGIKTATVVNFPDGGDDLARLEIEITNALKYGADEIDAVLPYREFLKGNITLCEEFLHTAVKLCGKKTPLKIILETGELKSASLIAAAAKLCISHGANFIKTSTGKTGISATPEAANAILETIASGRRNAGFKASGGIKTLEESKKYLVLANSIMGYKWICPKNFRIGASSLLDNLLEVIERGY